MSVRESGPMRRSFDGVLPTSLLVQGAPVFPVEMSPASARDGPLWRSFDGVIPTAIFDEGASPPLTRADSAPPLPPTPTMEKGGVGGDDGSEEDGEERDTETVSAHAADESMKTPHVSKLFSSDQVSSKKFGLTNEQMKRARALIRLGVTEDDLRVARRLLAVAAVASAGPRNSASKAERFLGYTHEQMSYLKALEVLGVSERHLEEERTKQLANLGVHNSRPSGDAAAGIGVGCLPGDSAGGAPQPRNRRLHGRNRAASLSPQPTSGLGRGLRIGGGGSTVAASPQRSREAELLELVDMQRARIRELELELREARMRPATAPAAVASPASSASSSAVAVPSASAAAATASAAAAMASVATSAGPQCASPPARSSRKANDASYMMGVLDAHHMGGGHVQVASGAVTVHETAVHVI